MAALSVFMLTFLEIVVKRKILFEGRASMAVTLFKNQALIYIFLTLPALLPANRNLIKKISFKN